MLTLLAITTCALLSDPNPTNEATTEIKYVTREDALREFNTENESWKLLWSLEWQLNTDYSFLFARHLRNSDVPNEFFRIYIKLDGGYALVHELQTAGIFEKTAVFWWTIPIKPQKKVPLIWIEDMDIGTAHFTTEMVYTIADLPPLKEWERLGIKASELEQVIQIVNFAPPPSPLEFNLKPAQGFWKGWTTNCNEHALTFQNWVFNKGDGNNDPTGGFISGTFKVIAQPISPAEMFGLIRRDTKYRVETDSFKYDLKRWEG